MHRRRAIFQEPDYDDLQADFYDTEANENLYNVGHINIDHYISKNSYATALDGHVNVHVQVNETYYTYIKNTPK